MKILKLIIFLSIVFTSCSSSKKKEKAKSDIKLENGIVFLTINNQALVFVNDIEIYDSGWIHGADVLEIPVNLNSYLKSGKNTIDIKLYNPDRKDRDNNPWEIAFEVYEDGEFIDYWFSKSDDSTFKTGYVLTQTYIFEVD